MSFSKSQNRLKLLFIVEAMGGGVFTYIVDLTNELADFFDVYIAYAVRPQTPENYNTYFDSRIHLIKVENFTRSIDALKDIRAYREIRRIERQVKPDVIHLHSSKAGVLGRWAFNGHKVPLFYTPHGYSFLMENNGKVKRAIYKGIESVSAKRKCTTISCSEGEHLETLKLTKNALYVNNGINIKQLQGMIDSVQTNLRHPFTVFTLGRICYQKNPVLFNKIAEELPDVKFIWIGDGEMREVLTAPNIQITGWLQREKAIQMSLQGDVFILTSLWEGLPISLLEAMYMKKLCVVNNVIGNRDVICTGVNGFVCDRVEDFVKAINSYACSGEIIERAYQDILNKYNTSVMARKYRNIYLSAEK